MNEGTDGDGNEQDSTGVAVTTEDTATETATKRQITFAVPPIDRLLVLVGACAMVLAGLLSWINAAPDAFPNYAGVGAGGGGVGLVVFLIGIALLSRRPQIDTANGVALGAFLASLITVITLFDATEAVGMGGGAWVAMIGSLLALVGVAFKAMDPSARPARHLERKTVATLGGVLAIIASFWMDWIVPTVYESGYFAPIDAEPSDAPYLVVRGGLDSDVATGYPVLVLSILVLLLLLGLLSPTASSGMKAAMAMHIRLLGIAVVALAAGDLLGSLLTTRPIGSGPILALIGGLMIARSVGSATGEADGETAEAEAS